MLNILNRKIGIYFQDIVAFERLEIPKSPNTSKGGQGKFMEGKFREDCRIHRKNADDQELWTDNGHRSLTEVSLTHSLCFFLGISFVRS